MFPNERGRETNPSGRMGKLQGDRKEKEKKRRREQGQEGIRATIR